MSFDVCGPLPGPGVTVLEASAGTGKTFTIAALAARYVAVGVPLEHLLLVTFTRMATGELRERVRDRLVTAEQGLAAVLAGAAGGSPGSARGSRPDTPDDQAGDDVLAMLAEGPAQEVAARRERLARAVADFDAATITTTHGFCQHVLSGLGIAGDLPQDVTFVEDLTDLVAEVVDDLYVRRFHDAPDRPPFDRAEALRIAHAVVNNPSAPIAPSDPDPSEPWAMRRRLADRVRVEVELRKRRAGVMTYDDLLTRLAATLASPQRGGAARDRLRSRYRIVLIDEFQDTDPVQWEIMRLAFGDGGSTLVLIGDPKQAIYAFRGADVFTYLEAARAATNPATLGVNWRSDQHLIDAYDALFGQAQLGHEGIRYRPVRAATGHEGSRLEGAPAPAPLRVRITWREDSPVPLTPKGFMPKWPVSRFIADDLAADVVRLLSSGARLARGPGRADEPVRAGHLAVLVRMHRQAALVQDALGAVGVPAVVGGGGSVFGTAPAGEWLRLLEALEQPSSRTRAASAALTAFVGWTARQVATAEEDAWDALQARLHGWASVWRDRGVAALQQDVTRAEQLPGRILGRAGGERLLTDLAHVGELLHVAVTEEGLGPSALTGWLRRRIAEAGDDSGEEERSRRLESDAEAVQVLTIHRSKGLEFPIVYCPYLWEAPAVRDDAVAVFHDPHSGWVRTVDVGRDGPGFRLHRQMQSDEQRGEDLRLAYVALSRARHQAVLWWAGASDSKASPLGRLLVAQAPDGTVAPAAKRVPSDADVAEALAGLSRRCDGRISVERAAGPEGGGRWHPPRLTADELAVAVFDRAIDRTWQRTSYTGITSLRHDDRVGSEPDTDLVVDEAPADGFAAPDPAAPDPAAPDPTAAAAAGPPAASPPGAGGPLLLGEMPGGVVVGTLVHRVLEMTDFAADDLGAELRTHLDAERRRRPVDLGDVEMVAAGLRAAIESPLGPLVDDLRLRDVGRRDRRDELGFELPLAGGDAPAAHAVTVAGIATVLRQHVDPADPLAGYPARLADPAMARTLRGYLTGSLDLVFRTPAGSYVVADYKTNWLGGDGPLTPGRYRASALASEMQRAHYPLQALLYSVALHRYLRWRLPGYDPGRHLGGVLYLFLRGMSSVEPVRAEGVPCGVFGWRPPVSLITALSDSFDA